ncbi:MAG: UTP:GlnB (protein PII) uridylyltransferase, partial [Flavobacteriales bacterium]
MNRPHSALLDRLIRGEALDTLRRSLVEERDALVRIGFERTCGDYAETLQVLAVGGYGRSDLYPHSDTDIVVLYDGEDGDDASASGRLERALPGAVVALEGWFRELNDGPARATVRVRAIPEHAKHILADLTVGTAALDARTVCGATLLPAPDTFALETLRGADAGGIHAFTSAHLEGYRDRHTRFGGSAHMLEPQLKMGRAASATPIRRGGSPEPSSKRARSMNCKTPDESPTSIARPSTGR